MADANPFKPGSRKADIYDVFKAKGIEAAYKRAESLGIKAGTVKSWSSSWNKGQLPTPKANGAPKPERVKGEKIKRETLPKGDDTWFRYDSMFKANKAVTEICERAGLRTHALHIIENEGKFAIVPISKHNDSPMPQFGKGDVVYDAYSTNSKARVIAPGPEQSEIRYDKEIKVPGLARPRECTVPNRYLVKLPDEPVTAKPKRERLSNGDKKSEKILHEAVKRGDKMMRQRLTKAKKA